MRRLKLFIGVTGAQWAKERLDCCTLLPNVDDIESYAHDKGLQISSSPNENVDGLDGIFFIDYFAPDGAF